MIKLLLTAFFAFVAPPTDIRHSFFIAGPEFTGIIDEEGKESFKAAKAGARDGFVLDNGHLLIAWADEVQSLAETGKFDFSIGVPPKMMRSGPASDWKTAIR